MLVAALACSPAATAPPPTSPPTLASKPQIDYVALEAEIDYNSSSGRTPREDVVAGDPEPDQQPASVGCHLEFDVEHDQHGRGWVWGSGLGRVTVRFEIKDTSPGPVWTFASDDPVA